MNLYSDLYFCVGLLTFFINPLDFHKLLIVARAHDLKQSLFISAQTLKNTTPCYKAIEIVLI